MVDELGGLVNSDCEVLFVKSGVDLVMSVAMSGGGYVKDFGHQLFGFVSEDSGSLDISHFWSEEVTGMEGGESVSDKSIVGLTHSM